jgi:hypothetical protein
LIGTFILVLFYNIQTHAYCKVINRKIINNLIKIIFQLTHDFFLISLDFFCVIVTARTMGRNGAGILNPALAFA